MEREGLTREQSRWSYVGLSYFCRGYGTDRKLLFFIFLFSFCPMSYLKVINKKGIKRDINIYIYTSRETMWVMGRRI